MTREEIYDRLIALAERAIEWRLATEVDATAGQSSVYLGENESLADPKSVRLFTSRDGYGNAYVAVNFATLASVSWFKGELHDICKIDAPYNEESLRLIERYLPEYGRLIAEARASTATASIL